MWKLSELKTRRRRIEAGGDWWDRACDRDLLWIVAFFCGMIAGVGVLCLK